MKTLKTSSINSSRTAILFSLILVIISIIIGSVRPLGKMRSESESAYYNGIESSGPNSFDLSQDLTQFNGLAANLITVADRNSAQDDSDYKTLSESAKKLTMALNAKDVAAQASEFETIKNSALRLEQELLANNNLSDRDRDNINSNSANMASLSTIITRESSQYNQLALSFNEKLGAIPAAAFKITGLIKPLPLFGY